ncbi:DUF1697 domain-containing protein [Fulvivirga kasyanovii]|uniref:DUF1697 domain-containing protein n=1 Tax=Fulvivirga kasyanovii TaxID=396812 RepID=A0ABW9RVD3_9BACT|nr:DUF1697 domain-containing protein [Fulvivirga kasyanovii]MTI27861.1 DUF1697 domain-containing protein [Fulvivirga kasyanovii]
MQTYIAILRGINVSGTKKIKMDDLRTKLTDFGFEKVRTYIQSGNIVFDYKETDPLTLAKQLEQKIMDDYGYEVPVVVTGAEELKQVIDSNPFLIGRSEDPAKLHVTFLAEPPADENVMKIDDSGFLPDEFKIIGESIYLFCPNGYGRTKLTNNFFESKLKVTATTRNWKTVNTLLNMAEEK